MTKKPEAVKEWTKMKPLEVEKLVISLGEKGTPPEKIGLILRDQHGIPKARIFGKKISQILKENKISHTTEYDNLSKKIETAKVHLGKHKHDYSAKRSILKHSTRLKKLKLPSQ